MAKSDFIRLAIALAVATACVDDSIAVAPGEPNLPAGEPGTLVNKTGVRPATTVVSKGGRVFLTHSLASLAAAASQTRINGKTAAVHAQAPAVSAMKTKDPGGGQMPAPVAQGPVPEVESSPRVALNTAGLEASRGAEPPGFDSAPRIELNGQPAAGANFLPPLHETPKSSQSPGLESLAESNGPDVRTTEPAPLADRAATLSSAASGSGRIGGAGGGPLPGASARVVVGALSTHRGMPGWRDALPWYGALAALLVFVVGMTWIHNLHKKPWHAYTEDWSDGFLWRWDWHNARIANLRCFCPTCQSEVILSAIASLDSPPPASEPQGTWALCPHCKEATCLETSDVSGTVSRVLIQRVNSGEYRETVAASKRKAGIALRGEVRIKTVGGRIL